MEVQFEPLGLKEDDNQLKMDKRERKCLFWDGKSCTLAVGMSPMNVPYRALDDI